MKHPLATTLREIADFLEAHPDILSEKGLNKELDKLTVSSKKVFDMLQSKALGFSPEAENVRNLLHASDSSKTIKDLQAFAKSLLPKPPSKKATSTPSSYLDDLVSLLAQKGQLQAAESFLRRQMSGPKLDFSKTDSDSLLVEIRKLGGMDDYTYKKESVRLLDKPDLLIKMAESSGLIKVNRKKDPTSKALLTKLRKLGETFHENRSI